MADDPIKSFMVQMGFVGDPAGAKKVAEEAAKVEAAVTKAAEEGAAKREAIEAGATAKRIGLAEGLGKIIAEMEQHRAERETKIRKDEAAQDEKIQAEREKKAKERRAKAVKDMAAHATRMATFALKAVGAVEATALGIVYAVDKAAKSMERLGYASQRVGSTPGKMTATGYAFSQLGGTAESGQAAVTALGEKLKTPGYDRYLKSIGVEARKANGELKVTDDILADLGEQLAKRQKEGGASGYRIAQAHAEALGLNTDQMQTIEDPRYRRMYAERQAIDAKMGTDEGAGAEAGSKFETSMRRLEATIESLKTKVATDLAKNIQPTLDKLADWSVQHGEQISNVIVKIADGIVSFAASIVDHLAQVNWDAVIKDVSDFGDKLDKKMTELFGDDGKMALALAGFAGLVGLKVLGPLNAVIRTLQVIGGLPLVGRLLGGAVASTAGITATALVAGAVSNAEMARRTGHAMTSGDPSANFDPETGFVNDLDFGYGKGEQAGGSNSKTGAVAWLKGLFGFNSSDPDARKVKDAIISTAEGVKKLADKTDGFGASTGGLGGSGLHIDGGSSAGASLGDRSRAGRMGHSGGAGGVGTFSTDMPPEARALLDTLASGEAKDYNVLNGGGTFSGYGRHPGGRAAGRYQFLPSTWAGVQRQLGLSDFSPGNQDKGAWFLAQRDYRLRTGRDLAGDLKSKDPARIAAIGQALHGTWVSTNGQFADRYAGFLAKSAGPTPQSSAAQAQAEAQAFAARQNMIAGGDGISGDLSGQAAYHHGQLDATKGLIFHHTGGRGTPEGVVQTLNQRGLGVQYVMDRDGKIFRTLPEGARGAHILRSEINDLNNGNTRGIEVIAKDDSDVTPAQVASGKAFADAMARRYPGLQVFGHGEVNPSHKMASEGHAIVAAFRAAAGQPNLDPNYKPAAIPLAQRTLGAYMGRDVPVGTAERPVHVELTNKGADRLNHLVATQAVLRAHRGHTLGVNPHSMLGRHIRHSIDMSRRSISIVHNPSFTMNGVGDPAAALSDAHRLAGRGQADLIRNMTTMTS